MALKFFYACSSLMVCVVLSVAVLTCGTEALGPVVLFNPTPPGAWEQGAVFVPALNAIIILFENNTNWIVQLLDVDSLQLVSSTTVLVGGSGDGDYPSWIAPDDRGKAVVIGVNNHATNITTLISYSMPAFEVLCQMTLPYVNGAGNLLFATVGDSLFTSVYGGVVSLLYRCIISNCTCSASQKVLPSMLFGYYNGPVASVNLNITSGLITAIASIPGGDFHFVSAVYSPTSPLVLSLLPQPAIHNGGNAPMRLLRLPVGDEQTIFGWAGWNSTSTPFLMDVVLNPPLTFSGSMELQLPEADFNVGDCISNGAWLLASGCQLSGGMLLAQYHSQAPFNLFDTLRLSNNCTETYYFDAVTPNYVFSFLTGDWIARITL
jgi:hypothetical protein